MAARAIVGFHQDEEGHWVADLVCGHTQHVRHDPPWQMRPWVVTPEGRARFIGVELQCATCRQAETVSTTRAPLSPDRDTPTR